MTRFLKEKGGIFTLLSITVVLGAATATTSCLDEQEGVLGTLCAVSGKYDSRREPHCVLSKPPLKGVVSGSKLSPGGGSSIYTVWQVQWGKKRRGWKAKVKSEVTKKRLCRGGLWLGSGIPLPLMVWLCTISVLAFWSRRSLKVLPTPPQARAC